jgi:hypothetical protein
MIPFGNYVPGARSRARQSPQPTPTEAYALGTALERARLDREKNERLGCSYPHCSNYKKPVIAGQVPRYCCNGCRWDHQDMDDAPKTTKVPIGAHALITFGSKPVVITADYIEVAATWFERAHTRGWSHSYCDDQAWMVLLNGAYQSTDYDPTQRYIVERGKVDRLYYVVDTTRMSKYWTETQFLDIARCYKNLNAVKIAKALNATQPKNARRKNGN